MLYLSHWRDITNADADNSETFVTQSHNVCLVDLYYISVFKLLFNISKDVVNWTFLETS